MPYNPLAIANYFIDLAAERGQLLSPMKLQKLVYFAHGWHLALMGEPLVNEPVEAWTFGPVLPSLYYAFKKYGNQPVDEHVKAYWRTEPQAGGQPYYIEFSPGLDDEPRSHEYTRALLDRIWDVYGPLDAIQLSNATHLPGTPWHDAFVRNGHRPPRDEIIDETAIRDSFRSMMSQRVMAS